MEGEFFCVCGVVTFSRASDIRRRLLPNPDEHMGPQSVCRTTLDCLMQLQPFIHFYSFLVESDSERLNLFGGGTDRDLYCVVL